MGIVFDVHNHLGTNYQEKYYQKAIEIELKQHELEYEKEKLIRLRYKDEDIGRYFVDFVIESKIVLETKHVEFFKIKDYQQVMSYLHRLHLKLAILVNFHTSRLLYKRILNSNVSL